MKFEAFVYYDKYNKKITMKECNFGDNYIPIIGI